MLFRVFLMKEQCDIVKEIRTQTHIHVCTRIHPISFINKNKTFTELHASHQIMNKIFKVLAVHSVITDACVHARTC